MQKILAFLVDDNLSLDNVYFVGRYIYFGRRLKMAAKSWVMTKNIAKNEVTIVTETHSIKPMIWLCMPKRIFWQIFIWKKIFIPAAFVRQNPEHKIKNLPTNLITSYQMKFNFATEKLTNLWSPLLTIFCQLQKSFGLVPC